MDMKKPSTKEGSEKAFKAALLFLMAAKLSKFYRAKLTQVSYFIIISTETVFQ